MWVQVLVSSFIPSIDELIYGHSPLTSRLIVLQTRILTNQQWGCNWDVDQQLLYNCTMSFWVFLLVNIGYRMNFLIDLLFGSPHFQTNPYHAGHCFGTPFQRPSIIKSSHVCCCKSHPLIYVRIIVKYLSVCLDWRRLTHFWRTGYPPADIQKAEKNL